MQDDCGKENNMRDDAVYCEPGTKGLAVIPFWRHEMLREKDNRKIKVLTCVCILLAAGLIISLVVR